MAGLAARGVPGAPGPARRLAVLRPDVIAKHWRSQRQRRRYRRGKNNKATSKTAHSEEGRLFDGRVLFGKVRVGLGGVVELRRRVGFGGCLRRSSAATSNYRRLEHQTSSRRLFAKGEKRDPRATGSVVQPILRWHVGVCGSAAGGVCGGKCCPCVGPGASTSLVGGQGANKAPTTMHSAPVTRAAMSQCPPFGCTTTTTTEIRFAVQLLCAPGAAQT